MSEKIKYVVTDPCYILSNEAWDKCCELLHEGTEADFEAFNTAIAGELTLLSGAKAWVADTGYGDWNNQIWGPGVIKHDFFADAGMVCVCKLTPEIEIKLDLGNESHARGVAIFETEGVESVRFDTEDSNWTVVEIQTKEGRIESNPAEEEEEEYDEDEDEEQDW